MDPRDTDTPIETLTGLVAVVTLPAGILAGMFLGGGAAGAVFVVGWLMLVPVLGILSRTVAGGETATEPGAVEDAGDEALQRLRERYAAGEIDEDEFERRVERLLETETLDLRPASAEGDEPSVEREAE